MMTLRTAAASATALAFSLNALPALAQSVDAQAVYEQLSAQLALNGLVMEAESAEARGDDVALTGVTITFAPETEALNLESVLLEDVTPADGGSFVAGRIAAPAATTVSDGVTVEFGGAELRNYFIAGTDVTDPVLRGNLYEAMQIGPISVSNADGTVFSMDGATATMSAYEPGGTMSYQFTASNLVADMTALPEAQARETMAALGYEQLRGDVTGEGSWDTASGRMTLDPMTYSVQDAADLSLSMDFGGFTTDMVSAMQDMQVAMQGQSEEAQSMAMLGLMQQLEVNALAIEIDDNSLTNRILDFVAEQQGMNRQSIVAMAKGALPLGLAQLQAPQFAASATAAVSAFLDNPQSLRISAQPADPVPIMQLTAAAMSSPQSLIEMLGVDVSANE